MTREEDIAAIIKAELAIIAVEARNRLRRWHEDFLEFPLSKLEWCEDIFEAAANVTVANSIRNSLESFIKEQGAENLGKWAVRLAAHAKAQHRDLRSGGGAEGVTMRWTNVCLAKAWLSINDPASKVGAQLNNLRYGVKA